MLHYWKMENLLTNPNAQAPKLLKTNQQEETN
jgi:hypothetical protein